MLYQEAVTKLPEPWRQFLRKTFLLESNDNTILLVVPDNERMFYNSLEFLSIIYPLIRKIYSHTLSLIIVSGNEYDLVKTNKLEIIDVRLD